MRAWQSVRHVNGVAVYAEEEGLDGEGGALMVSAIVRSSPQECFEVGAGRQHRARRQPPTLRRHAEEAARRRHAEALGAGWPLIVPPSRAKAALSCPALLPWPFSPSLPVSALLLAPMPAQVLMASGGSKSAGMLHGDERVLEVVDRHTQVRSGRPAAHAARVGRARRSGACVPECG